MCLVAQSCPTLRPHGLYVARQAPLSMGILQSRILEEIAMPFSRGSSQPKDWTQVSRTAGGFFAVWASRDAYPLRLGPPSHVHLTPPGHHRALSWAPCFMQQVLTSYRLWELIWCHIILPFILFMGFLGQEYRSGLPFPFPVDHVLSELSTIICPSWVALHGVAHSFIELHCDPCYHFD